MTAHHSVVVVGAGPVGLFAALLLAQRSVDVLVLETENELGAKSKASTFHPSTLDILDAANVAEELLSLGVVVDELQWRDLAGAIFARMPFSLLAGVTGFPYRLHAEQTLLTPILLRMLTELASDSVRFGSRCESVELGSAGVTATVDGPDGRYRLTADYLLAADGAHSGTRAQLGIEFPGESYESRALRIVTEEDLSMRLPGASGITYIRDKTQSCSLLRMRDHWRLIFRVTSTASDEELLDQQNIRDLVDRIAPDLPIAGAEIYSNRVHVASQYSRGRVVLMGDAAHVTTTAGGMNMNCGLHDAYAIAQAVADVTSGAPESTVVEAAEERRRVVLEAVIPRTESRAAGSDGDPAVLAQAVEDISGIASDPEAAFRFVFEASMLDTTPHIREKP